jgi:toxin HigB-1
MIKHFKSKVSHKLFLLERASSLPFSIQRPATRKLWMLDSARDLRDLRSPPSNHLEKLVGKYSGKYSIRINRQWRIVFRWEGGHAYEVEIIDYH